MSIWILALIVMAICAVAGLYKGAIRMSVSLIGLFVAIVLAVPLSPWIKPLVPKVGLTNIVWSWLLPPVVVFFLLSVIFIGLGFIVHRKVELYFKYKTDDVQRIRWERLNRHIGLCLGIFAGATYMVLIGVVIFALGYTTVQLSAEDSDPTALKMLNKARNDLHDTGFDKTVAGFDPMPKKYYDVSDILGLIYHNPLLHSRLTSYPPYIGLTERADIQEILNDADLMNKIQSRPSVAELIKEAKIQGLLTNQEVMDELKKTDLNDLRTFLETGKSPKYEDEKIIGRWVVDADAMITYARKRNPDMTAAELMMMKNMAGMLSGVTFIATADNKTILKVTVSPEMAQAAQQAAQAIADAAPAQPAVDPRMAQRYGPAAGRRPGPTPPPAAATPQAPQPPRMVAPIQGSGQGEWKNDDGKYTISIQPEQGPKLDFTGEVRGDELVLTLMGQPIVFVPKD